MEDQQGPNGVDRIPVLPLRTRTKLKASWSLRRFWMRMKFRARGGAQPPRILATGRNQIRIVAEGTETRVFRLRF